VTLDLPYPKDDPATIAALATRLTAQGEVLRGAQQRLIGHRAGIQGAWTDPAGGRAAAEVGTVAGLVHTGDAACSAASGALGAYRSALETARGDIDGLRRQAQEAVTARAEYIRRNAGRVPPDERPAVVHEADRQLAATESALRARYETVGEHVTRAARTAAGTISELSRAIGAPPGSGDPAAAVAATLDGVLPSVHQQAMTAKADEAAQLARKVPFLTDEEAARLAAYSRYAQDPAFATALQRDLGPDGLLYLAAALTKMVSDDDPPTDRDKAAARIQQLLASTLATATNPGNEPHLDAAWIARLKAEGRRKVDFGSFSFQPYGYQLLGVLLKHGTYSSQFLSDVGGDMLAFEHEHGKNAEVWAANQPAGAAYRGFHLDLIDGAAGFDPMVGLMKALANNPQAAKDFFAVDPGATGSRVDYLLTDRVWMSDDPTDVVERHPSPGTDSLGRALDLATTGRPRDATSASIMEAVVHHLGDDAETRDGVVEETDLAPPNARDSLGHMLSTYVGDVNAAFDPNLDRSGDWDDPALPGREAAHARFDRFQLMRVLADTGKDPGAYAQLSDTQRVYTALALDAAATDGNPLDPGTIGRDALVEDRREAVGATAHRSAAVFGALDFGHNAALEQANETRDQATNDQLEANGKAASFVVGQALGKVPIPGLSEGVDAYIDALVENSKADSTGTTNYEIGRTYGNSQNVVSALVHDTLYRNNVYESTQAPPASLRDAGGHLVPEQLMTGAQRADYNRWVQSAGGRAVFAPVGDAVADYGQSYDDAQRILQDNDHG
jgi:hypothetical protein